MRTAIILLLLVGAGSAVGSFFPQRPIEPTKVGRFINDNPGFAPIAEWLGLFDVYGSWWFMTLYGLLLVSLVGCLLPRYRALARTLRTPPRAITALARQPRYASGTVPASPDEVLERARGALRARRFRAARTGEVVAAEKGYAREIGSIAFHTAFFVLLLGMAAGKFFGYRGQVAVVEGTTWRDTHVAYDTIEEGRFFNERHRGFTVALDEFDVSWWPNGVPRDFVSKVRVFDEERLVRREDIRVNAPLTYRGVRLYQLSWGWAPRLVVRQGGEVLYDGPTIFLPRNGRWHGVVKLPATEPQEVGLDMFLFTDPGPQPGGGIGDRSPRPENPVVLIQPYAGDLGLNRPQSVYSLDFSNLGKLGEGEGLPLGGTVSLPNDIEVSFPSLEQYSVFEVASNPGAGTLLLASVLILVGLIPALYSSRRRVWVRATPSDEGGALLEVAGYALQRTTAFDEEFAALVRDIDRDLRAAAAAMPERGERLGARDG